MNQTLNTLTESIGQKKVACAKQTVENSENVNSLFCAEIERKKTES